MKIRKQLRRGLNYLGVGGSADSMGKTRSAESAMPAAEHEVAGLVVEKLPGYGLAHVQTESGELYAVNRKTPGVEFDKLKEGQQVRCIVADKPLRLLRAEIA